MIRFDAVFVTVCGVLSLLLASTAQALAPTTVEVYWDVHPITTGGIPTAYTPTGRYSAMVDHLAPLGFHISEGTAPLDTVSLDPNGILVIADGSDGLTLYTPAELGAIDSYVKGGGGLLLLTDINGSSGTARMKQVVSLFGVQILGDFFSSDITSTSIIPHPALAGVDKFFLRYSSTFSPGVLTPYAFHYDQPMLAAGQVGKGRVVLIADGDLFTIVPNHVNYFDREDNRQLAESTFAYLAVPEPASAVSAVFAAIGCIGLRRGRSWTGVHR